LDLRDWRGGDQSGADGPVSSKLVGVTERRLDRGVSDGWAWRRWNGQIVEDTDPVAYGDAWHYLLGRVVVEAARLELELELALLAAAGSDIGLEHYRRYLGPRLRDDAWKAARRPTAPPGAGTRSAPRRRRSRGATASSTGPRSPWSFRTVTRPRTGGRPRVTGGYPPGTSTPYRWTWQQSPNCRRPWLRFRPRGGRSPRPHGESTHPLDSPDGSVPRPARLGGSPVRGAGELSPWNLTSGRSRSPIGRRDGLDLLRPVGVPGQVGKRRGRLRPGDGGGHDQHDCPGARRPSPWLEDPARFTRGCVLGGDGCPATTRSGTAGGRRGNGGRYRPR